MFGITEHMRPVHFFHRVHFVFIRKWDGQEKDYLTNW